MSESDKDIKTRGVFFFTPDCEPYFNMAFDEYLFSLVNSDDSGNSAFLRLYSWKNPGITIGYNQKVERALDRNYLDSNIPVIRRITGGRAIYHDSNEITFSLSILTGILPVKSDSLSAVNSLISETVVKILNTCGLKAKWNRKSGQESRPASKNLHESACFDSVSRYEITSDGRKIAGIAQRLVGSAIIHQGSIKINGISDYPAVGQKGYVSGLTDRSRETKLHKINDIKESFVREFSKSTGISFIERRLSEKRLPGLYDSVNFMSQNPLSNREFV